MSAPPWNVASFSRTVVARGVARIPLGHERRPRLEDERLDPCGIAAERVRDLRLRQVAELVQRQRGALLGRQRDDVAHHRLQRLAPLDLGRNRGGAVVQLRRELGIDARRPAVADRRQGVVARDAVEPGARVLELRALAQHPVGGHERLLDDVLGRRAVADVLAREREQAGGVAVVQLGEGPLVAAAGARGEGAIAVIAGLRARRGGGADGHLRVTLFPCVRQRNARGPARPSQRRLRRRSVQVAGSRLKRLPQRLRAQVLQRPLRQRRSRPAAGRT